ncbi:hypothetical protein ACGFI9_10155 [Micromonospora sp. NPDC048930]|uniref:hypothetical protein n=1 Tax=Micromonospora sp. NPDC048930 TaxID=3364261 RepID=UPI003712E108
MTQTIDEPGVLGAVLATVGSRRPVETTAPQDLTCRMPHDLLLPELLAAVDELVPYATELKPVRRRLYAMHNPSPDDPVPTPAQMASRVRGVERAWVMTVTLGPALRQLAELARPGRYLPPFDLALRGMLWQARAAYCAAIAEALADRPPARIEFRQDTGDQLVGAFRVEMPRLYLYDRRGLETTIGQLAAEVTDLLALRAERGSDALATRAADAEAGVTMTTTGADWFLRRPLLAELQRVRDYPFHDYLDPYVRFSQKLQIIGLLVLLLSRREQLSWLADQPVLPSAAADRLDGYVIELAVALSHAEASISRFKQGRYVEAAEAYRLAVAVLEGVTGRREYQDDVTALTKIVEVQKIAKAVAAGVLVGLVSAVTAGAAGAAAGMVLATVIDTTTVAGSLVVAAGTVGARLMWETVVARAGTELLLGPDAITGSSFLEDLGWQAAQTAAVRVVLSGSAGIFTAAARSGERTEQVARLAVEQIATFGFGEVQHLIKTGELRSLRDSLVAAVQQVATTGVVLTAGLVATSFVERFGDARGGLTPADQQALATLDQTRAAVHADFAAVRDGTATPAQVQSWLSRAADAWNGFVTLLDRLPMGAERDAAFARATAAKAEIELRLAEVGITATLTLPDGPPTFQSLLPGLVAVSGDGAPTLDTVHPPATRAPGASSDTTIVTGTGGRRLLFLPASALPDRPATPDRLVHVPEVATRLGPPPEPVVLPGAPRVGLSRLQTAFGADKVAEILGNAARGREQVLSLVAHPELENVGRLRAYATELRGLAADPHSVAFGRRWGPVLVFQVRRKLGTDGLRNALDRFAALLEQVPPAERPALIARLLGFHASRLRRELELAPPLRPPGPRPSPRNMGVDRGDPVWPAILDEVIRSFGDLTEPQQQVMADCRQVIERAEGGAFHRYQPQTRLGMIDSFEQMMVAGQIRGLTAVANGMRGRLAEHLFLGPLPVLQQTMWLGGRRTYTWLKDRSNMDGHWMTGTVPEFLELKSDEIHLQSAAEQRATAQLYLQHARLDFTNIPAGSRYHLWFIRDPGADGRSRMLEVLMPSGGPITGVYFGPQPPPPAPQR